MAIFGEAHWPGVNGFISCEYTCSHGARPSIASLTIPEQKAADIIHDGTLIITDGVREVKLQSARVVDIQYTGGTASTPRMMTLHIADRRWMWAYGGIAGYYNQIDPEPHPDAPALGPLGEAAGPYLPGTVKTASDLIALCFTDMRFTRFHIDAPPMQLVPVQWDDETPANALQDVVDAIGYRLIYRPTLDDAAITPLGTGDDLPLDLPIISSTPGFKLPSAPAEIYIAGGPTMYCDWLELEPVGYEADGRVQHIDKLSYKPDHGWKSSPPFFPIQKGEVAAGDEIGKGDSASVEESYKLAREHVYRSYRVRMRDIQTGKLGYVYVGGYGKVVDRRLIKLKDREFRLEKLKNGRYKIIPPYVIGSVFLPRLNGVKTLNSDRLGNTEIKDPLPLSFSIDEERGIVKFDDYVIRRAADNKVEAPTIYLSTSFEILKYGKLTPERYSYQGANLKAVPGCPPEVVQRPEIVVISWADRGFKGGPGQPGTPFTLLGVKNNRTEVDQAAKFYADAHLAKYLVAGEVQEITYGGIWPIVPNGKIHQITWRVGGNQPATTTASSSTEHSTDLPRYPEKRRIEKLNALIRKFERIDQSGMPKGGKR